MGMALGFALFIGVLIGLLVSALLVGTAIIMTGKSARTHAHAWRTFVLIALAALPVLALAVYYYPYETGTPGSNYSILFKHFFLVGFAYAAIPGAAALVAFLAILFCPKTTAGGQAAGGAIALRVCVLLSLLSVTAGIWLGATIEGLHAFPGQTLKTESAPRPAARLLAVAADFYAQGNYRASAQRCSQAIESGAFRGNALAEIYVRRGWCHSRLENNQAAAADFERALQLDPQNAEAFNGRGWAHIRLEKYAEALADFETALRLAPRYAMVFNNRGVAFEDMGRRDPARKSFEQAIALDNDPEAKAYALFNLAWLEYQDGRLETALAYCERGLEILPADAMGYNDRGAIREDMGQTETALADYARAIELDSDPEASAYARLNRGTYYLIKADYVSAARDFTAVMRTRLPMKEEAAVWLFISLKDNGKSREEIERALAESMGGEVWTEWPAPALDLFRERLTPDEFAVLCRHPNPVKYLSRRAELLFFTGQYWSYRGQTDKDRDCLERCLQLGVRDSNATRLAKAGLAHETKM